MNRRIKQGSMTVEASFVVPFTIVVIIIIAYLCIYMCNSTMAAGILDRHINQARLDGISNQRDISDLKADIEAELKEKLIGTSDISVEIYLQNKDIVSQCSGKLRIPIGWRSELSFAIDNKTSSFEPVGFIRNIRRVVEAV